MMAMDVTGDQRQRHDSKSNSEAVFLLHGLVARPWMMLRISRGLKQAGYQVTNWGYPTLWKSIEDHAERLHDRLAATLHDDRIHRVHFVTHSMGSIIVRRMLLDANTEKFGRVVMLGPPNRGSNVARVLSQRLDHLCPALSQLSDAPQSYVNRMPEPVDIEVGVIAAEGDLVVPVNNTRLDALTDWTLLPGHHSALPWRPTTIRYIKQFLRSGQFGSPQVPTAASHNPSEH